MAKRSSVGFRRSILNSHTAGLSEAGFRSEMVFWHKYCIPGLALAQTGQSQRRHELFRGNYLLTITACISYHNYDK